jgi:serine/threonine protein kinase
MSLAYWWLYYCFRILHRDISSSNIMFCRRSNKVCGVLNDLDLPLRDHMELVTSTSQLRTGTPLYVAIDLLQGTCGTSPIRHLYRHDLESLAYVILLQCSRYRFEPSRSDSRFYCLGRSPFDNRLNPVYLGTT